MPTHNNKSVNMATGVPTNKTKYFQLTSRQRCQLTTELPKDNTTEVSTHKRRFGVYPLCHGISAKLFVNKRKRTYNTSYFFIQFCITWRCWQLGLQASTGHMINEYNLNRWTGTRLYSDGVPEEEQAVSQGTSNTEQDIWILERRAPSIQTIRLFTARFPIKTRMFS